MSFFMQFFFQPWSFFHSYTFQKLQFLRVFLCATSLVSVEKEIASCSSPRKLLTFSECFSPAHQMRLENERNFPKLASSWNGVWKSSLSHFSRSSGLACFSSSRSSHKSGYLSELDSIFSFFSVGKEEIREMNVESLWVWLNWTTVFSFIADLNQSRRIFLEILGTCEIFLQHYHSLPVWKRNKNPHR